MASSQALTVPIGVAVAGVQLDIKRKMLDTKTIGTNLSVFMTYLHLEQA